MQLMQSHLLKTFTASFDPGEDRIRLDCILVIGKQSQVFFTNRLSKIFVKELLNQIDTISNVKGSHELIHDFACSSRENQEPAEISHKDTEQWLTKSIDFVKLEKKLRIIFKDDKTYAVHLEGDELLLRNILDIFYKIFLTAGWDTNIFPSWVDASKVNVNSSVAIH